jgi:SAM-dependent methyltransferase
MTVEVHLTSHALSVTFITVKAYIDSDGDVMTTLDSELASAWVDRWDAQQEYYVADREERFAVIGDVVAHSLAARGDADRPTTTGTVLDLGCGPGSLAGRLAERLPGARIIGVDSDPLLLALARTRYGRHAEFVDADLTDPAWTAHVPATADAAVSTTALHWLDPEPLAALYRTLAGLLRPGGVFVDGDHLGLGDPTLDEIGVLVRRGRTARNGIADREDWAAWWTAVGTDPALSALMDERSARAIAHHGSNGLSVAEHVDLLRAAGFASAGSVWQSGDDHVLVAVR